MRPGRYLLALVAVALAVAATWAVIQATGVIRPFPLLLVAVIVSSWFGGRGPGLLASVLGTLASDLLFIEPVLQINFDLTSLTNLAVFLVLALWIATMNEWLAGARRRAEQMAERLRVSEERYRSVLHTAGEGIWLVDAEGRTTYANGLMGDLLGYNPDELLGRTPPEFIDPDRRAEAETYFALQREGVRSQRDLRFQRRDGAALWAIVSASPLEAPEGGFGGALYMITDITARRQVQEALQKSEERFRALFESASEAVVIVNEAGEIVLVNSRAESTFGYSRAELLGRPVEVLLPGELHAIHARHRRAYLSSPHTRPMGAGLELVGRRQDGHEFPVEVSLSHVETSEGPLIMALINDITERRRAERAIGESREQFEIILRSVAEGITAQDASGALIFANDAAARLIGFPSAEALLGTPVAEIMQRYEVLDEDGRPVPLTELPGRRALRGEDPPPLVLRFRPRGGGGEHRYSVVDATPVFDDRGRVRFAINVFHDVTERRRAELERARLIEELERQRQRLNNLVANVPGVVWETHGPAGAQRVTYVSEYAEQLLGYSREEWTRTPNFWLSIVHPDDRTRVLGETDAIADAGRGTIQFRWLTREGQPLWVETQAVAVRGDDGQVVGLRGVTLDISARKRAELERLQLANHLSLLLESTGEGIYGVDRLGMCTFINSAAARMVGYEPSELIGVNLHHTIHHSYGDGRPYPEVACPVTRTVSQGDGFRGEEHLWRRDGSAFPVDYSSYPLRVGGRIEGAVVIFTDNSERQRAERERAELLERERAARLDAEAAQQRLSFLAEASTVLGSSLDYETTLANVASLAVPYIADWCAVYLSEEDGVLRVLRELAIAHVDPARADWAREMQQRYPLDPHAPYGPPAVVRTGVPELVPEITNAMLAESAQDEEHLALLERVGFRSYMCVPLRAHGRVLGAISFIAAESGRRLGGPDLVLAESLAQRAAVAVENARLYQGAQEAVRVREQFLSIASHELRTPVTVIQGYTQGLARLVRRQLAEAPNGDSGEPESLALPRRRLTDNLQKMEEAIRRLTTLIDELLDVGRFLQKRRLAITPQRMELVALIHGVIDGVRVRLRSGQYPANIALQLDVPETPVWGDWDPGRLEQVLVNLIDNAIKYSPAGGEVRVSLAVEAGEAAPEQRWAHLSVRDEGIGIALDQQVQLFQPFVRAANASARNFPGLGLGLAISKEIVEHHGGRIWVESAGLNTGSTFHVALPDASIRAGEALADRPA
jgi:PAS domain S-box-containing protein